MKISSEKLDIKKTYLAVATMLLAILCIDLYMAVSYTHLRAHET